MNPAQIQSLHDAYVRLTGRDLTLDYNRHQFWAMWTNYRKHEPFTIADLELVIKFLQSQIRKGERKPACLKFNNLICSPDWFEDDLQDARGQARKPNLNTPKARALVAMGRLPTMVNTQAKTTEQIMLDHQEMARLLKEYREKNL